MSKKSLMTRNENRAKLAKTYSAKRKKLKAVVLSKTSSMEEKFDAQLKLQALPRNSNPNRVRNRCLLTGRPRGNYRKFKISRNKFRELASSGQIPGVIKASW